MLSYRIYVLDLNNTGSMECVEVWTIHIKKHLMYMVYVQVSYFDMNSLMPHDFKEMNEMMVTDSITDMKMTVNKYIFGM